MAGDFQGAELLKLGQDLTVEPGGEALAFGRRADEGEHRDRGRSQTRWRRRVGIAEADPADDAQQEDDQRGERREHASTPGRDGIRRCRLALRERRRIGAGPHRFRS